MIWNDATEAKLRTLWASGLFTSEIARELGTTRNAIIGKAHRMELPERSQAAFARRSNSPFTGTDIHNIRQRYAAGETQSALAKEFGVTAPSIWAIVNHFTWRDVA